MRALQVSFSDGLLHLTTTIPKMANLIGYSSRTKITQRDAFRYLNKILPERKLIQINIMLTRLINSIVSWNVTSLRRNLRTHGALTTYQYQMKSKKLDLIMLNNVFYNFFIYLLDAFIFRLCFGPEISWKITVKDFEF